ncbi:MAG: hypothetical protein ACXVY5_08320 [Gaiellales bacterium]
MGRGQRMLAVLAGVAVAAGLIAWYVVSYVLSMPPTVAIASSGGTSDLTMQTVAGYGHAPHPDWVSYLVKNDQGKWVHSTIFKLPANSLVNVTIYQFDTATGLRNPFLGQPRGVVGGTFTLDGKTLDVLDPDLASHTFTVPDLGLSVPLAGVADDAPNQCSAAPCPLSTAHRTITFQFHTGAPGTYRWQCFVPCGAGWIFGNGGPMQTVGWMDGFLKVV